MRIFAFSIFIGCALILTNRYMWFMELIMGEMFASGRDISIMLQVFATIMFPATFFMFMFIGYLTYYFIWRAFKVEMELKWALILITGLTVVLVWDAYQLIFL